VQLNLGSVAAPLWYHALVLPYTPLVSAADKGAESASQSLLPGLRFTVLLDGRPVAHVGDDVLEVSSSPRWVPLTTPADSSIDAGSLLVMCSFDKAVLTRWSKFVSENVDAALQHAVGPRSLSPQVKAVWECAKWRGVSKDFALPLAWTAQPWFPVLKPYRVNMFAQGLRDLVVPYDDTGGGGDFPAGQRDADWRIEVRLPDASDALLAAGGWHRHKQIGSLSASLVNPTHPGGVTTDDDDVNIVDGECHPKADADSGSVASAAIQQRRRRGLHARYTPWDLPLPLNGKSGEQQFDDSACRVLDEKSASLGVWPPGVACLRTASVPLERSCFSIVLTGRGLSMNPLQAGGALLRDQLRQLCLTNPQVLMSQESDSVVWLPASLLLAPDAVIYVWRRPTGVAQAAADNDGAAMTWNGLVQVCDCNCVRARVCVCACVCSAMMMVL
jgi:hypothetical protein